MKRSGLWRRTPVQQYHAAHILAMKRRLNEIYVKHTGQSLDQVEEALERDNFMTAERAKEFGIVDRVITDRATLGEDDGK